jgi:hypothetical protein
MNIAMVSVEISVKTHDILKMCAEKNKFNKNQLASLIVNNWDGDKKIFKEAHRSKLGEFVPEYDNVRLKGISLNVNISLKANKLLIDILNDEKNLYTKPGMVRDLLLGFLIFKNKKLIKKLKSINIICDDYIEFLKFVPEIDTDTETENKKDFNDTEIELKNKIKNMFLDLDLDLESEKISNKTIYKEIGRNG